MNVEREAPSSGAKVRQRAHSLLRISCIECNIWRYLYNINVQLILRI